MTCTQSAAKLGAFACPDGHVLIARESFERCYVEALPLLERHRREIAHFPDIELDVDCERYLIAEDAGRLRVYTARVDQRLVGYAVFFVMPNAHYMSSLQAVQDVLYVDPDFRRGSAGVRLVRDSARMLAEDGVQVIYHHVKNAHPKLGAILVHMGYEPIETIYARRIY